MDVTAEQLLYQCDVYLAVYPWVFDVDSQYGLPHGLLLAVGSRETDLILGYANGTLVGDGGYGHGTRQEDDHPQNATPERAAICDRIQSGDCAYAAQIAAAMLQGLLADCDGSVDRATDMYNSGSPYDYDTTGGDYGTDVAERLAVIQAHFPDTPAAEVASPAPPPVSKETPDMIVVLATGTKSRTVHGEVGPGDLFVLGPTKMQCASESTADAYCNAIGQTPPWAASGDKYKWPCATLAEIPNA